MDIIESESYGYVKSLDNNVVRVVGVPYTSQDAYGDYFSEQTDDGELPEVLVYFNHNKFFPREDSAEELEKSAIYSQVFKGEILGRAKRIGKSPEGVLYDIILDDAKWYSGIIKDLLKQQALRISTGAKYREPNSRGHLDKWHVVELSVTPTPANPNAVSLIKSYIARKEETKVSEEVTTTQEATQTPTILEQVEQAFSETEEAIEQVVATVSVEDVLEKALTPILQKMEALQKSVDELLQIQPLLAKKTSEMLNKHLQASSFEKSIGAVTQVAPTPQNSQAIVAPTVNHPKAPKLNLPTNGRGR